jgi:cytochrome c biogenesis protein CcdA
MSDGTCKVTNLQQRRRTHLRITDIATRPFTMLTAVAVIGLALSVNIIEFACSIGIPQAFTKILDLNGVSFVARHGLMLLYILGYMIDDFIVFGIALWGIDRLDLTHRYARASNVIGGVLMLALGMLLIFRPDLLHVW